MTALKAGRVAALIVDGHRVVLIERRRAGELYYLFPGGRIEPGETPEACLLREVREETGLEVEIVSHVATIIFEGAQQPHYLARVLGGTFGPGSGEEFLPEAVEEQGSYVPMWMPVARLSAMPVHPQALAEVIAQADDTGGWPHPPIVIQDAGRRARTGG